MSGVKPWLLGAALLFLSAVTCFAETDLSRVKTVNGMIQGQASADGLRFLGVRYAAPPVGPLRWAPPQPVAKWSGAYDATKLRDKCPQMTLAPPRTKEGSEDCLYLNIYAPVPHPADKPLPVMVWFHGGSFVAGSAEDVDGRVLAAKAHIIVIPVNYRLGAFGFFASPSLDAESTEGVSGNQGLRDQQMAMRWIKKNIRAFGGDPARVTLAGQSAGAWSNWVHLASPGSEGLFHQVMGESWPVITHNYLGTNYRNAIAGITSLHDEETAGPSSRLLSALGCASAADKLNCARAKTTDEVLYALDSQKLMGPGWQVVYDGKLLPDSVASLFERGAYRKMPMLTGFNFHDDSFRIQMAVANGGKLITQEQYEAETRALPHGDAVLAAYPVSAYSSAEDAKTAVRNDSSACSAYDSSKDLSRNHALYLYEFADLNAVPTLYDVNLPAGVHKDAFHTAEIAYIFQTGFPHWLHNEPPPFTAPQKALSDRMIQYWGSFVREGRPTKNEAWPSLSSSDAIYVLKPDGDTAMKEREFSIRHNCAFWRSLG